MASKKEEETGDGIVNAETLGRLLMITDRHIQRLAKEGVFETKGRGKYPMVSCVHAYIRYLKEENKTQTKVAGDNRLRDARAKEIEIRVAKQDRSLIDLSEAQDVVDKMAGTFLQSMVGLPARITRNVNERKRIENICDKVRKKLANRFAEIGESLRTGDDPLDAIGEENS